MTVYHLQAGSIPVGSAALAHSRVSLALLGLVVQWEDAAMAWQQYGFDSRRVHSLSALSSQLSALVAKLAKARGCNPRIPRCNSGRALHNSNPGSVHLGVMPFLQIGCEGCDSLGPDEITSLARSSRTVPGSTCLRAETRPGSPKPGEVVQLHSVARSTHPPPRRDATRVS